MNLTGQHGGTGGIISASVVPHHVYIGFLLDYSDPNLPPPGDLSVTQNKQAQCYHDTCKAAVFPQPQIHCVLHTTEPHHETI